MTYDDARRVALGDRLRTDFGDVGTVENRVDTGVSVLFLLWGRGGRLFQVHSSHSWPAPVEPAVPASHDLEARA